MHQPESVLLAEKRLGRAVEFESLLPAADMVLVTAQAPVPTLPVWACMAAAKPIVATVSSTISELLEDRHTALLVPQNAPRLLAQHILNLREDAQLQWKLSDMARTEAYEYAAQTRFLEQYRAAYRQCAAGGKVDIPEPAPGRAFAFTCPPND